MAIVAPQVAAEKAAAEAAAAEAALRGESLDDGTGQAGSPAGFGGDDYSMGGTDGGHQQHDMDQNPYQQHRQGHHMEGSAAGDDISSIAGSDRTSQGGYRGGFRDRGRGGRWRGRGAGRGFRGRGRGDH